MNDSYKQARGDLVEAVGAKGFRPERSLQPDGEPAGPSPVQVGPVCPVGCCNPQTGASVEVEEGQICERHEGKLSKPMRSQLSGARGRARNLTEDIDLLLVLDEAVKEARRLDSSWSPFVIIERDHAEHFESWEAACRRYFALLEEGLAPAMSSSRTAGTLLSIDQIRTYCPHTALGADGEALGAGPTLNKAIAEAGRRHMHKGRITWPDGIGPTMANEWGGDELSWSRALECARRGTG